MNTWRTSDVFLGTQARGHQEVLAEHLRSPTEKARREGVKILIDRILDSQEVKDWEAANRDAQRFARQASEESDSSISDEARGFSTRKVYAPVVQQQRKFTEQRHRLPDAPEETKNDVRGIAHASILLLTKDSSVPAAEVDDWLDRLKQHGYSWDTMVHLVRASRDHLADLRRDELATGTLDRALRFEALIREIDSLAKMQTPTTPALPAAATDRERTNENEADLDQSESEKAPASRLDFSSVAGRVSAINAYRDFWAAELGSCSEASLARAAKVDPSDLSRWKKTRLPGSEKATRIEGVLKNKTRPIPPLRMRS